MNKTITAIGRCSMCPELVRYLALPASKPRKDLLCATCKDRRPDLVLTDRASEQVKKLLVDKGLSERAGLHVFVTGGGCAGFEYGVKLEERPSKFELLRVGDKVIVCNGVRILTDDKSLMFIRGSTIDWKEVNLGYQFVFENPLSTGTCGCGVSFSA